MKKNYIYKFTGRGLCSELNSFLHFYEGVVDQNCRIYIDTSKSQYFKNFAIHDVFNLPDVFVSTPQPDPAMIGCSIQWSKTGRQETSLTKKQCSDLFSYTDDFQKQINATISKLLLPPLYNCFHIRRGDKVNEKPAWTSERGYGEALRFKFLDYIKLSSIKTNNLFVMTDDYKCIEEGKVYLSEVGSSNKIFFLVEPNQDGHSTKLDHENKKSYSREELVQFFTEIEIAKQSQQFIGTQSSNVFRYIKAQCIKDVEFISLDY